MKPLLAPRPLRLSAVLMAGTLAACSGDLLTGGPLIRPGEPTGFIKVVNASSMSFPAILISACDVGSYGLDRLPDGVSVPPGSSYSFEVSAGCWDVDAGNGWREARQRMQVPAGGGVRYTVTDE